MFVSILMRIRQLNKGAFKQQQYISLLNPKQSSLFQNFSLCLSSDMYGQPHFRYQIFTFSSRMMAYLYLSYSFLSSQRSQSEKQLHFLFITDIRLDKTTQPYCHYRYIKDSPQMYLLWWWLILSLLIQVLASLETQVLSSHQLQSCQN